MNIFTTIKQIPMGIEYNSFINGKLATQYDYTSYMRLMSITTWNSTGTAVTEIDTFNYNAVGLKMSTHMATGSGITLGDLKYNYTGGKNTSVDHFNQWGILTQTDEVSYGYMTTQIDTFKYNAVGLKMSTHMETPYHSPLGDIKFNYTNSSLSSASNYNSAGLLTSIDTIKYGVITNHDITVGHGNTVIGLIGVSHYAV